MATQAQKPDAEQARIESAAIKAASVRSAGAGIGRVWGRGSRWVLPLTVIGLLAAMLLALSVGRYPLAPRTVLQTIAAWLHLSAPPANFSLLQSIVIGARLPRLLAAALVGAALSVAGASYQAVFRNPLLSPDLLGVLSGAAFGAALSIVLGLASGWVPVLAFVCGLGAVAVGLGIAAMLRQGGVITLVLGGLISSALFASLLSLVKYMADPLDQLPTIIYWLLGSLAQTGWSELDIFALPLLVGIALLCVGGRLLDALSLSDDEARSLGIPVGWMRIGVIALATLISALTVSVAGMIVWVGLLVPHIARLLVGAGHARLLPMSALLGAIGVILADTCARSVSAGEIPLGIITELFGALAFVLVLRRLRHSAL